jgi:hypothetical protein
MAKTNLPAFGNVANTEAEMYVQTEPQAREQRRPNSPIKTAFINLLAANFKHMALRQDVPIRQAFKYASADALNVLRAELTAIEDELS